MQKSELIKAVAEKSGTDSKTVGKIISWNIVNKVDTKLRKRMKVCRFKIIGGKKIVT